MSSATTLSSRKRPSPSPSPALAKRAKSASPPRHQETEEEPVRLWDISVQTSPEFARQGLLERPSKVRGTRSNVVAWARLHYANQSITINATEHDPVVLIDDATVQSEQRRDKELRQVQAKAKTVLPDLEICGTSKPATIDLWVDSKHYKL